MNFYSKTFFISSIRLRCFLLVCRLKKLFFALVRLDVVVVVIVAVVAVVVVAIVVVVIVAVDVVAIVKQMFAVNVDSDEKAN